MTTTNALKIIEALGKHKDANAINVLRDIGTNSPIEEVRECTAKALIERNTEESLKLLIDNKGKGINDLSTKVALSTVNQLLEIQDKNDLLRILDTTIAENTDETVKNTARSLRALINLSK